MACSSNSEQGDWEVVSKDGTPLNGSFENLKAEGCEPEFVEEDVLELSDGEEKPEKKNFRDALKSITDQHRPIRILSRAATVWCEGNDGNSGNVSSKSDSFDSLWGESSKKNGSSTPEKEWCFLNGKVIPGKIEDDETSIKRKSDKADSSASDSEDEDFEMVPADEDRLAMTLFAAFKQELFGPRGCLGLLVTGTIILLCVHLMFMEVSVETTSSHLVPHSRSFESSYKYKPNADIFKCSGTTASRAYHQDQQYCYYKRVPSPSKKCVCKYPWSKQYYSSSASLSQMASKSVNAFFRKGLTSVVSAKSIKQNSYFYKQQSSALMPSVERSISWTGLPNCLAVTSKSKKNSYRLRSGRNSRRRSRCSKNNFLRKEELKNWYMEMNSSPQLAKNSSSGGQEEGPVSLYDLFLNTLFATFDSTDCRKITSAFRMGICHHSISEKTWYEQINESFHKASGFVGGSP